jgi:L-asparaginase
VTDKDKRARVLVLSLGGTIASTSTGGAGVVPQLSASDLLEAVPGITDVADITAMSVRQIPSGDLTFADLVEVARIINDQVADGVDGVSSHRALTQSKRRPLLWTSSSIRSCPSS